MSDKMSDKMSVEELKKNTLKYESKIHEKHQRILDTLKDTNNLSNCIGDELNENSESLERINDNLDEIEHKLNTSEYLIKRFSSWFSYFKPIKTLKPFEKISNDVEKTKFEKTNIKSKFDLSKKEEDFSKKEEYFYDDVYESLDKLQKDAETFGKILKEQEIIIDKIDDKTEKSYDRIKKTIVKVKKF